MRIKIKELDDAMGHLKQHGTYRCTLEAGQRCPLAHTVCIPQGTARQAVCMSGELDPADEAVLNKYMKGMTLCGYICKTLGLDIEFFPYGMLVQAGFEEKKMHEHIVSLFYGDPLHADLLRVKEMEETNNESKE